MGIKARVMLTTGLLSMLTGCCSPEPGANRAKALTQDQLAAIYMTVERASREKRVEALVRAPVPMELSMLEPRGVLGSDSRVMIHLYGCVDDKSYLRIEGLGRENEKKRILLYPGEHVSLIQLWPRER